MPSLALAKPAIDLGLVTQDAQVMLAFYRDILGLPFEATLTCRAAPSCIGFPAVKPLSSFCSTKKHLNQPRPQAALTVRQESDILRSASLTLPRCSLTALLPGCPFQWVKPRSDPASRSPCLKTRRVIGWNCSKQATDRLNPAARTNGCSVARQNDPYLCPHLFRGRGTLIISPGQSGPKSRH